MRIESMTATFGKLQTETLTLTPGLNVLEMPNETGKSTWCAFLLSMFYGVDTAERETRTNLPMKKHYAPWSGCAMEGSIRLEHEGRHITIERSSTARSPLGVFRAFDTETGLPIEELNARNCAQILLGVPRQVFERSAFLRQDGMSIQMETTLEQRLGALVTTGDETISYQDAERILRERRNRCRHNKTGLIPQTEAALDAVMEKLNRLNALHETMVQAKVEEQRLRGQLGTLRLQLKSLQVRQAEECRAQLAQAEAEATEKSEQAKQLTEACAELPATDELVQLRLMLKGLKDEQQTLALDHAAVPPQVPAPTLPPALQRLSEAQIVQRTTVDASYMRLLQAKKKPTFLVWAILAALFLIPAFLFALTRHPTLAVLFALVGSGFAIAGLFTYNVRQRAWLHAQSELQRLYSGYGVRTPDGVEECGLRFREKLQRWAHEQDARACELDRIQERKEKLEAEGHVFLEKLNALLPNPCTMDSADMAIHDAMAQHMERENAVRSASRARDYCAKLRRALGSIPKPTGPTVLIPEGATIQSVQMEISSAEAQLQQVRSTLDRSAGQCSTLGDPIELEARRQQLCARLDVLNQEYDALSTALSAIGKANEALRSRFSPQLTALAAEYLDQLTDGTYSRLMLDRNLGASLYPEENPASRDAAYFSGGTRDQLYLAVRLAVSQLLVPGTPLILDDALVRFDDERMKKAIEVLQKEAEKRQVLLFTCQSRENAARKALEAHESSLV